MQTNALARVFGFHLVLGWLAPLGAQNVPPPLPPPLPPPTAMVSHHDPNTGLTVLRATLSLPVPGQWTTTPGAPAADAGLREIFVTPTAETAGLLAGRRMSRRADQQELERDQWPLTHLGWALSQFAEKNAARPPKSLDELGDMLGASDRKRLAANYQLLDDLTIDRQQPVEKTKVVAFETAPLVDDAQHWVLLSNGRVERRAIDPLLAARPGVKKILPRRPAPAAGAPAPTHADYTLLARVLAATPATLKLHNKLTGKTAELRIDPALAAPGPREVLGQWACQRLFAMPLDRGSLTATILPHWYRQAGDLYGCQDTPPFLLGRQVNDSSIFNVLGGRAAITETLQMQDIGTAPGPGGAGPNNNDAPPAADAKAEVPIAQIKGVEVKSHPFEEMLGGQPGGRIELAEVIPADRLFAYFPKPAGLTSWLDGGARFLFNAGSSTTGRNLEYDLSQRYLAALGIDREWMRRLLDSGAVAEIGLALPDLFLIDGTELTVVARLNNPVIAAGLLKLLGLKNLETSAVRNNPQGESSHWARRGDLLMISSDAGELERVLQLHAAGGKDSLGRSAELRYMLTKLPLRDSTRAFVYLSDPFIRDLVGPATKIAQHRRMRARGEMEALLAGSLLHALDGNAPASAAQLVAKKYAPAPRIATDAALDGQLGAVSPTFGPLSRMHSITELGITAASAAEAAAYRSYVENYSRFWRQFFDPIALRIDEPEPASYELSVFILPLIDNSIYNGLREVIASEADGPPLLLPVIQPEPVATLSLKLRDKVWVETGGEMLAGMARKVGLDTTLLDYLGPDVHLALADSDPILEMGNGELAHLFGGSGLNNSEWIAIPALVSMFTRPTALCVGLSQTEGVRHALDNSVGREADFGGGGITGNLYKITGRDGWIYRLNFFGVISLRLGIELQDRFLVIRNMPLTTPFQITGTQPASQPDARLSLSPRACRLQLPALFASAGERERAAAHGGISDLQPLLVAGVADSVESAAATHKSWYGFRPLHPPGGQWTWDGRHMTSTRYGSLDLPTQPDYTEGSREFGVLRDVDTADVGMHFEDDGLRSTVRWRLRPTPK